MAADPSALGDFMGRWGACDTLNDVGTCIVDVESLIEKLSKSILEPIIEKLGTVKPVEEYCSKQVCADLEGRIATLEIAVYEIQRSLEYDLLVRLEPIYIEVNQMITYLQQIGFQAVGPVVFQPLSFDVDVNAPTTTYQQTTNTVSQTTTTIQPTSTQLVLPSPPASGEQEGYRREEVSQEVRDIVKVGMELGSVPVGTVPTSDIPFWFVLPIDSVSVTAGKIVKSSSYPNATGLSVYGPFFTIQQLYDFIAIGDTFLVNNNSVTSSVSNVGFQNPSVIVTVNCPSGGSGSVGDKRDKESASLGNVELGGGGQGTVNVLGQKQLIEWLMSDESTQYVKDFLLGAGIKDKDLEEITDIIGTRSKVTTSGLGQRMD